LPNRVREHWGDARGGADAREAGKRFKKMQENGAAKPNSNLPRLRRILIGAAIGALLAMSIVPYATHSGSYQYRRGYMPIYEIRKIADLKVISQTSRQHYARRLKNLPEIARQVGAAHILEGRVQKIGDAVRVNVQLIKAANDSHLWADTFDRKLTDIFSVQSEVGQSESIQISR
jgi:hypothetical protein